MVWQGQQPCCLNKAYDISLALPTQHSKHSKVNKNQCVDLHVGVVKQSDKKHPTVRQKQWCHTDYEITDEHNEPQLCYKYSAIKDI